jgi:hypothetical protein
LSRRWLRLPKIWVRNDIAGFEKITPQKEPGVSPEDPPKTAYGKKLLILSCDPATLGDDGRDNKPARQQNVIKLHCTPRFRHLLRKSAALCGMLRA